MGMCFKVHAKFIFSIINTKPAFLSKNLQWAVFFPFSLFLSFPIWTLKAFIPPALITCLCHCIQDWTSHYSSVLYHCLLQLTQLPPHFFAQLCFMSPAWSRLILLYSSSKRSWKYACHCSVYFSGTWGLVGLNLHSHHLP